MKKLILIFNIGLEILKYILLKAFVRNYVSGLSVRPSDRPSFRPSHLRGTTLRAAPSKNYAYLTNYHACIVMPT